MYGCYQRVHLCLGVGLRLQIVVYEVVYRGGDEVGNQRVGLRLGVIVGNRGGDGRSDGGVHLGSSRVHGEGRIDGCADLCIGLSLRVVVAQVDGSLTDLLEVVDDTGALVAGQGDILVFDVAAHGMSRRHQVDDTRCVG